MKYLVDLIAILIMGDGLAKVLSLKHHNRFYQFKQAPPAYNAALETLHRNPPLSTLLGIVMLFSGAWLSRKMEHRV